jgi:hypothetical protein
MTDSDPDQTEIPETDDTDAEASQGPSGFAGAETSAGGADAVPETPDNVPADGSLSAE